MQMRPNVVMQLSIQTFCFALEKNEIQLALSVFISILSCIVSLTLFVVLVLIVVLHRFCAMVKLFAVFCEKIYISIHTE